MAPINIYEYFKEYWINAGKPAEKPFASYTVGGEKFPLYLPEDRTSPLSIRKGDLEFRIDWNYFPEIDAVEYGTTLINHSDKPSDIISDICVFDVEIATPFLRPITHKGINGDFDNVDTFRPIENNLSCGTTIIKKPYGGKSSHCAFPFFDICEFNDNAGMIFGIGWGATWFYRLERTKTDLLIQVGLPDARFYMEPGEELRLPRMLMLAYYGDNTEAHNRLRRLLRDNYSPKHRYGGKINLPISLQTHDRYANRNLAKLDGFRPTWDSEEDQLALVGYGVKSKFCDTYWLDAAWFEGSFPHGVGNYSFKKSFPNGLTKIEEEAHKNGLRNMIWFEPERVDFGTEVEKEHPEFVLSCGITDIPTLGYCGGRLFDMSNPEAVDWLIEKNSEFIEKYKIDIYRHDFNIYPHFFWDANDKPDRRGILEIKYVAGLYRFWDTLLDRFPGLMIDNCASGGNRLDYASGMRTVSCWRSDTGCRAESYKRVDLWHQNQSLSLPGYIVYQALSGWRPTAYDVRTVMSSGYSANYDVFDPNCDFEKIQVALDEVTRMRKYWEEDFYPLAKASMDETCWVAWQVGSAEAGCVNIFRRELSEEKTHTFALRGLDEDKDYLLKIADEQYKVTEVTASGKELMAGYIFTIEAPKASLCVEYIQQ